MIMFVSMAILFYDMKQKIIFICCYSFILGFEVYAVLEQAIEMINLEVL